MPELMQLLATKFVAGINVLHVAIRQGLDALKAKIWKADLSSKMILSHDDVH